MRTFALDLGPVSDEAIAEHGLDILHMAWVDIETRKVVAPQGWHDRLRWEPFMIAMMEVVDEEDVGLTWRVTCQAGNEQELVDYLADYEGCRMAYASHNRFDEMVLRGRFRNARRPLSPYAGGWAHCDGHGINWHEIKDLKVERAAIRGDGGRPVDVHSKEIPALWKRGQHLIVAVHCIRDAIEVALMDDGFPDAGMKERAAGFLAIPPVGLAKMIA
jgi:hypothetical protein